MLKYNIDESQICANISNIQKALVNTHFGFNFNVSVDSEVIDNAIESIISEKVSGKKNMVEALSTIGVPRMSILDDMASDVVETQKTSETYKTLRAVEDRLAEKMGPAVGCYCCKSQQDDEIVEFKQKFMSKTFEDLEAEFALYMKRDGNAVQLTYKRGFDFLFPINTLEKQSKLREEQHELNRLYNGNPLVYEYQNFSEDQEVLKRRMEEVEFTFTQMRQYFDYRIKSGVIDILLHPGEQPVGDEGVGEKKPSSALAPEYWEAEERIRKTVAAMLQVIDPSCHNQLTAIYYAMDEMGLLADGCTYIQFLRMLAKWFPEGIPQDDKTLKKIAKSIGCELKKSYADEDGKRVPLGYYHNWKANRLNELKANGKTKSRKKLEDLGGKTDFCINRLESTFPSSEK